MADVPHPEPVCFSAKYDAADRGKVGREDQPHTWGGQLPAGGLRPVWMGSTTALAGETLSPDPQHRPFTTTGSEF